MSCDSGMDPAKTLGIPVSGWIFLVFRYVGEIKSLYTVDKLVIRSSR